jgi:DNA-binding response OmpR family regulator
VLLVDDEPAIIDVVARYLRAVGHDVVGAGDAEEAAAILGAGRFDFVLVDLVLPGRTGLQALAEFAALTSAPLHLMSGQTDPDTRRDALLLGAASFVPKPLDLPAICALIDALPEP